MLAVFQSFIPWILYFIIAGSVFLSTEVAALTAVVATIVFGYSNLRKKYILDWASLLYFVILAVLYRFPVRNWLIHNAFIVSNIAIALIMWFSIVVRQPFTIEYAKQQVPEFVWDTPGFRFVNYLISSVWAVAISLMFLDGVLQAQNIITSVWINDAIIAFLIIVAIVFNQRFPDWYQGFQFRKNSKELEDISSNPFLNGNFAPVKDELFVQDLTVEGKIPEDLIGIYMRNGPNPEFHPISYTFPIDGDGMIHAVYINNGKANYRNRFIETKGLLAERKAGRALYGGIAKIIPTDPRLIGKDGDPGPLKNGAFVHVIRHADQYLALLEANTAYQLSADLQTVKEWCPQGAAAPLPVNAHTRLDPDTGNLSLITYDFMPPYLTYYELDSTGELIKTVPIDKPYSTMMHDFVTTKNYIIFFDCPAVFDTQRLATGDPFLSWRPELKARIGIMSKADDSIEWIETDTFWVFHFANAFERDNKIIIDYVRHDKLQLGSDNGNLQSTELENDFEIFNAVLYRAEVDLLSKSVAQIQLHDMRVEFPRINDVMNSKPNRYIYMPTTTIGSDAVFNALIKYDLDTQQAIIHDFGEQMEIGEAVFAPANNSQSEDDGYVMLYTYDKQNNSSDFVIIDAQDFSAKPLARIKLPRRVPYGLHGSWLEGPW